MITNAPVNDIEIFISLLKVLEWSSTGSEQGELASLYIGIMVEITRVVYFQILLVHTVKCLPFSHG